MEKTVPFLRLKELLWLASVAAAGSALLFLCPMKYLLGVLAVAAVVLFAARKPDYGVFFLVLIIPFARIPYLTDYVEILRLVLFSVVALAWITLRKTEDLSRLYRANPYNLYFMVFAALVVTNLFLVSQPDALRYKSAATHLLAFVYFYFFLDFFHKHRRLKTSVMLTIAVSTAVSLIAIAQYLVLQYKIDLGIFQRVILPPLLRQQQLKESAQALLFLGYRSMGTFFHPNMMGIYVSLIFPVCLATALTARKRGERLALYGALFLLSAAAFTADSRGSFLSIFVSSCLVLCFFWDRVPKALFAASVVSVAGLAAALYVNNPAYYRFGQLLSHRDVIWSNSFRLFLEHPFGGSGIGTFSQNYFAQFSFPSTSDFYFHLTEVRLMGSIVPLSGFHAHNLFLQYGVEMGVFAVLWVFLFFGIAFHHFFSKAWRVLRTLPPFELGVAVGGSACFAGSFVFSFFEGMTLFYDFSIAMMNALLMAAVFTALRAAPPAEGEGQEGFFL